jgi:hypothetical protein
MNEMSDLDKILFWKIGPQGAENKAINFEEIETINVDRI